MGEKQGMAGCAACCCSVLYLVSIILVGCSFDTLGPLEAGIEFNTATKSINADQVFTSGRYFLGLGKAFLKFPRNFINIEYGSSATADEPALIMERTQVTIECSLQYTLSLEDLTTIYSNNNLQYHDKMVKEATNAIKNVAADYEPNVFYEQREFVAQQMHDAAKLALATQHGELRDFQLRKVTLKAQNEEDVIRKIVTAESQRTAINVQAQNKVTAATTVIVGEQDRLISIFQANKTKEATILTETAEANAKTVRLDSQTSVFSTLKQQIGFSQEELLQYLWLKRVKSLPTSSRLLVGFDDATVKLS